MKRQAPITRTSGAGERKDCWGRLANLTLLATVACDLLGGWLAAMLVADTFLLPAAVVIGSMLGAALGFAVSILVAIHLGWPSGDGE